MKQFVPWLLCGVLGIALLAAVSKNKTLETTHQAEIAEIKASTSSQARPGSVVESRSSQRANRQTSQRTDVEMNQTHSDAEIGETLRNIIENPIGKAMMSEEGRIKAARIYRDLIKELNLAPEEEEYFTGLLAADIGATDATGMKLLGAKSNEERIAILEDMEKAKVERKKSIKDFLNSDEDYGRFTHYQDRQREYEQLATVRSAIASSGMPLASGQEEQLVEAMYQARTDSGMTDAWEGRAGMEQFGVPGVADRFTEDWNKMQGILTQKSNGILDQPQQEAFEAQQVQSRDLALFTIKMAESMIRASQNGTGASDAE